MQTQSNHSDTSYRSDRSYPSDVPVPSAINSAFEFLVIRAIQRAGVSYRRQQYACAFIPLLFPRTFRPDLLRQAQEIAQRCLLATRRFPCRAHPDLQSQIPNLKLHSTLNSQPSTSHEVARNREAAVLHLREHLNMRFREISSRLDLRSPDRARTLYARACRRRRQAVEPSAINSQPSTIN